MGRVSATSDWRKLQQEKRRRLPWGLKFTEGVEEKGRKHDDVGVRKHIFKIKGIGEGHLLDCEEGSSGGGATKKGSF